MSLAPLIGQESTALTAAEQSAAKKAAALAAVGLVRSGMTLGLGTGSTVAYFLEGLAQRVKAEALEVRGVPTSVGTAETARSFGIPLVSGDGYPNLTNDLCVDGADRVDTAGNLIKGGGGALLREKLVASHSAHLCILVDASKLELVFGESFPLPVECVPFGIESTMARLRAAGYRTTLRLENGTPKLTDNGNYVVDCGFVTMPDPAGCNSALRSIPGVVEVGLFIAMMSTLILGRPDGSSRIWP